MTTHIRVPFRARVLSRALLHVVWAAGLLAAPTAAVHGAEVKVLQYTLPAMPPITQLPPKGSKLAYGRPSVHASVKAKSQAELVKQSLAGLSIPLWNGSDDTECCGTFDFSMVGTDPTVPQSIKNQTTVIAALLIPVKFTFSPNIVFDPRKPDNCGSRIPP